MAKKMSVSTNGVDESTVVEVVAAEKVVDKVVAPKPKKRERRERKETQQPQVSLSHNSFRFRDQLSLFLKAGSLLQAIEDLIVRQLSFCDRSFKDETTDEKRMRVVYHTLVLVLVDALEFLRREGSKVASDTATTIGETVAKSFSGKVLEGFITYRFNFKPTYRDTGLVNWKAVSWARHQIGHVLFDYVVPQMSPDDGYELAEAFFRVAELEGFDLSRALYDKYDVWYDAQGFEDEG